MKIIKLNLPERPRFAITDPIIQSDTLFSAIVNCYAKLYGGEGVDDFVNKIKISSIFVGLKVGEAEIYFLPKPHFTPKFLSSKDVKRDKVKNWKKVKLISKAIFEQVMREDENIEYEKWSNVAVSKKEYEKLEKASKLKENFDKQSFIKNYSETKNALNRYSGASEDFFTIGVLEFQEIGEIKPFLYFFTEELEKEMLASLNLMVDEGLGAERSTGKGILQSIEEATLELTVETDKYINLSLTMPQKIEEAREAESYQFVKRGGYVFYGGGTGWRKKRVRMFDIGSVFTNKIEGENIESEIRINGEDRTIYHYGKAFLIGGKK